MSSYLRRVGAIVLATATLGVIAVGSATAAISTAAFCANVTEGSSGFTDIGGVATPQRRDIECLAASRITSGTGPSQYSPNGLVFRDSMATFVANLVDTANNLEARTLASLPPNPPDAFTDDNGNTHERNINRLAAAGIVSGKTATTYGTNRDPEDRVRRGQMATFLVKAIEHMRGAPLPAGPDAFPDDNGHTHETNINKLAAIDVVDGRVDGTYGPDGEANRTQMASFLVRTLAYLHQQGDIFPLPPSTRSILLSPSGDVTNTMDSVAGDEVAFAATNIVASTVDLALFPCENVAFSQGTVFFADSNPNDGQADPGSDQVEADIVSVNGNAQPANTEFVNAVPVTDNRIEFLVDSTTMDCVVAVVWDDANSNDRVDLDANDRSSERFGASGRVQFVPPPAGTGAMDENVMSNDEASNSFIGCEINEGAPGAGSGPEQVSATDCFVFTYDDNDTFHLDNPGTPQVDAGEQLSLAQFEQRLSTGDDVGGNYVVGGVSQFILVDESPAAPGGVQGQVFNGHTVQLTFNEVPGVEAYRAYAKVADPMNPFPAPAGCEGGGAFSQVGQTSADTDSDADTTNVIVVTGLPIETYCFVIRSVDEGDESGNSSPVRLSVTAVAADQTPPRAIDATIVHSSANAPSNTRIDNGDVITICFNEDMAAPAQNSSITVQEADDGASATIANGPNGTFALTGNDRCIQITINVPPTPQSQGTDDDPLNINTPVTVTGASGIRDAANNAWAPGANDTDRVIDEE